jgi:hypothetical protein
VLQVGLIEIVAIVLLVHLLSNRIKKHDQLRPCFVSY